MSKPDDFDFYCEVALKPNAAINIEYESDTVLAFHHTESDFPFHVVVISKAHIWDIRSVEDESLLAEIMKVARDIVKKHSQDSLDTYGMRIVTNIGKFQETPHLHFHVIGGVETLG